MSVRGEGYFRNVSFVLN